MMYYFLLLASAVVAKKGGRNKNADNGIKCEATGIALANAVNDARAARGLDRLPISVSLSKVAWHHAHQASCQPYAGEAAEIGPRSDFCKRGCNLHSWDSAQGAAWNPCCYSGNPNFPGDGGPQCIWNKPKEITEYQGMGYEVSYGGGRKPIPHTKTVEAWLKSPGHRKVILSEGSWERNTRFIGCASSDLGFAHCWFGAQSDPAGYCGAGKDEEHVGPACENAKAGRPKGKYTRVPGVDTACACQDMCEGARLATYKAFSHSKKRKYCLCYKEPVVKRGKIKFKKKSDYVFSEI